MSLRKAMADETLRGDAGAAAAATEGAPGAQSEARDAKRARVTHEGEAAPADVAAMGEKVGQVVSHSLVAMAGVLGLRLGLYDKLKAHQPCSSAAFAAACELDPRFTHEWLLGQASNGLAAYDADTDTFFLTPAQAVVLTDKASLCYSGGILRICGSTGRMLELLQDTLKTGVGYGYDALGGDFTLAMEETLGAAVTQLAERALGALPAPFPALLAAPGTKVADVGCGAGKLLVKIAQQFPQCEVHGYDVSADAVTRARANAAAAGVAARVTLHNVTVAGDAMPAEPTFHLAVAHDVVHDLADPLGVLRGVRGSLLPGGALFIVDVPSTDSTAENLALPGAGFAYAVSLGVCLPSATVDGPGSAAMGTLGLSPRRMAELSAEAGFASCERLDGEALFQREHGGCYLLRV